jgi:hypothetical protein
VILAYNASSGFSLGLWLHRLRDSLGFAEFLTDSSDIFVDRDGTRWTSLYFRSTYLILLLEMQRKASDSYLTQFDGSPGITVES